MIDITPDLFICGKCQMDFTDLNEFLEHRSICSTPLPLSATLSTNVLDDIIMHDVSSTENFINEPISNEFDLLFSSPVDQIINSNELILPNAKDSSHPIESSTTLICPVCDKHFIDGKILENHLFEHSICPDDQQYSSLSSISVNFLNEKSSSECERCAITFTSIGTLNQHKRLVHCSTPMFRCLNVSCSKLFDKPIDYIRHARVHSQKVEKSYRRRQTYRCRICKVLFLSNEQLENHLANDEHQLSCQLCSAVFHSNNSYHNHLAQHTETIPVYRCDHCQESFQKRTDLSKHIAMIHQNELSNQKSCLTCKLTFKTTFHLNRHNVTKHSDIKPFKCKEEGCQQAFARKDKLKQHESRHSAAGGMFKCQVCVKSFVRREHLRDHDIVRHSHQFPFRCEYCRKGFLHHNQLYSHYKQHHFDGNENEFVRGSTISADQQKDEHV